MLIFAFLLLFQQTPPAEAPPVNELLQIKTVYVLPMGSGFDQFLANRLTRKGILQVVTDPEKADAILTERVGKAFEEKMEELYPAPKPPEQVAPTKEGEDEENTNVQPSGFDLKSVPFSHNGSFGRGKGTIFLVHRGSRNVVWSTYEPPKSFRANDLDYSAKLVADRLDSDVKHQVKSALKSTSGDK